MYENMESIDHIAVYLKHPTVSLSFEVVGLRFEKIGSVLDLGILVDTNRPANILGPFLRHTSVISRIPANSPDGDTGVYPSLSNPRVLTPSDSSNDSSASSSRCRSAVLEQPKVADLTSLPVRCSRNRPKSQPGDWIEVTGIDGCC